MSLEIKSKGHIAFFRRPDGTKAELYQICEDLFTAPIHNVIDLDTENRIGRWEGPAHMKSRVCVALNIALKAEAI